MARSFLQGALWQHYTKKISISHCGKGTLCCSFDLAKVFLQGATTPPLHHCFKLSLACERGNMLLFRLSQGISSGCHHATLHQIFFWICLYCWKGTLRFCSDLAMLFLQGATMPLLHQFFWNCHCFRKFGIMLLLRLRKGISSRCHHATPTPNIFGIVII